ncbi:UDP-N-acetylmuramate dehydrogenase [Fundidesulfovibrio agrisoli]|uniref:UDP-N-acetylmuramate dehydrogenase n=1 Tax=Fundidesulfovibrio agrisoli TaxID=2922717 RepID=UPI001FAC488B|nr:UDP-N-acetylmuramate dehydrogenase [Fundidesulfovibrio agrisoli]
MALKIQPGPRFAERTTLRVGGRAQAEILLESPEDAALLGDELARHAGRPFVLGWGSNLLALDGDLDIAVVSLGQGGGPVRAGLASGQGAGGRELVVVPGGYMLPKLLNWAAREGLSGMEGLSGIPGTVGGAVAMNAGSYGRETAELLDAVRVWDMSGGLRWIGPEQWLAAYRRFTPLGLDEPWLVLEARYALTPAAPVAVRAAMDDVLARKKATQPVSAATCGCVFKNPPGVSAGKMLDELGFKGKALGGMRFSNMHANFLVNDGRGTAMAALELIDQASQAVLERFGVELELEVKVVQ